MDIPWDEIRIFLAVADTASMSRGAKKLRMGQPTVSRRIALLEHQLGFALFRRDVSGVKLTPEGQRLLEPARRMADWAGEVHRAALARGAAPRGLVRIATFPGFAWEVMAPFAVWLRTKHAALRLEVLSEVGYVDLARGEADLAIRLRPADHDDLVTVATLALSAGAFASPEYARKLPANCPPQEIDWIAWAPPHDQLPPNPVLAALIPGFVPIFTSDNILVQRRAAEAGMGAMMIAASKHRFAPPSGLVQLDVALPPLPPVQVYVVCAKSALEIPHVRAVVDVLRAELAAHVRAPRANGESVTPPRPRSSRGRER